MLTEEWIHEQRGLYWRSEKAIRWEQFVAVAAFEKGKTEERERCRGIIGSFSDSEDWDLVSEYWKNRLSLKE